MDSSWGPVQEISWFIISRLVQPIILISMAIGLPSLLLYCSQCWVIVRHPQFHNPFYTLFIVRAFQDILLLLSSYAHFRLPTVAGTFLLPIYQLFPNWLLVSMLVLYYYSMEASSLATTFLLLNRLSSIMFPFKHEELWRKLLPPVLVIIFGFPLYFWRYFFGMQCWFQINDWDGNRSFCVNENHQNADLPMTNFIEADSFILFVASVTFLVLCLLINLGILFVYRRQQSFFGTKTGAQQQQQKKQKRKTETKLIVYAVCTFASHMLLTILMICNYLAQRVQEYLVLGALLDQTPWVFDLGCIVMPAWLLLWASSDFRLQWCCHFLPIWLQKRPMTNTVNVMPITKSLRLHNANDDVRCSFPKWHHLKFNNKCHQSR